MIITILLANASIFYIIAFFFVVRTFKIYSLSNVKVYNTVFLATITILYIRSEEHVNFIAGSLYPFTNICLFPCHSPSPQTL